MNPIVKQIFIISPNIIFPLIAWLVTCKPFCKYKFVGISSLSSKEGICLNCLRNIILDRYRVVNKEK